MNIKTQLTFLLSLLDFMPGLKTKLGAVAAFIVAIVSAWGALAPAIGLGDYTIVVPPEVNAVIMALIGVGASNSQTRLSSSIQTKASKK